MGQPPAIVIIARHGARLDAANKQWHLTSPAPYDPPLTYGGWRQSQVLGTRIASIIHTRETTAGTQAAHNVTRDTSLANADGRDQDNDTHPRPKPHESKRRKHKVIIHTSPFLRCVQTSIAISAGIAEYQDPFKAGGHASAAKVYPMHSAHPMHSGSPHIRAMDHTKVPHLDAIPEPDEDVEETPCRSDDRRTRIAKSQLRIDAFLGEWLSPDYFESITPPPSSVMMVAGAKADLLRRDENAISTRGSLKDDESLGDFPGARRSGEIESKEAARNDNSGVALASISSLKQSLPRVDRANDYGSAGGRPIERVLSSFDTIPDLSHAETYVPPTPSYAISPLDPIPLGYVAHAKEYCMDTDYAWDSMRPPLDWGSGGEYGEEWGAMHKRFRRGLHSLILWYGSQNACKRPGNINEDKVENQSAEDDDEETDTVIVLVTHSAGCNALIGALTNQPVLLDVGMASLTMAVRKEHPRKPAYSQESPIRTTRRRSSIDLGISDNYEVKITASTEHLRAGTHTKSASLSQRSSGTSSPQVSTYRHRSGSTMSTASTSSSSDGIPNTEFELRIANRINTTGSLQRSASAAVRSPSGLWSKPVPHQTDGTSDPEVKKSAPSPNDHPLLRSGIPGENPDHRIHEQNEASETTSPAEHDQAPTVGQQGLWGAPPLVPIPDRDKGPKRRWTHSEHR